MASLLREAMSRTESTARSTAVSKWASVRGSLPLSSREPASEDGDQVAASPSEPAVRRATTSKWDSHASGAYASEGSATEANGGSGDNFTASLSDRAMSDEEVRRSSSQCHAQIIDRIVQTFPDITSEQKMSLVTTVRRNIGNCQRTTINFTIGLLENELQAVKEKQEKIKSLEEKLVAMNRQCCLEINSIKMKYKPQGSDAGSHHDVAMKRINSDTENVRFFEPMQHFTDEMRYSALVVINEKLASIFKKEPSLLDTCDRGEVARLEASLLREKLERVERHSKEKEDEASRLEKSLHKATVSRVKQDRMMKVLGEEQRRAQNAKDEAENEIDQLKEELRLHRKMLRGKLSIRKGSAAEGAAEGEDGEEFDPIKHFNLIKDLQGKLEGARGELAQALEDATAAKEREAEAQGRVESLWAQLEALRTRETQDAECQCEDLHHELEVALATKARRASRRASRDDSHRRQSCEPNHRRRQSRETNWETASSLSDGELDIPATYCPACSQRFHQETVESPTNASPEDFEDPGASLSLSSSLKQPSGQPGPGMIVFPTEDPGIILSDDPAVAGSSQPSARMPAFRGRRRLNTVSGVISNLKTKAEPKAEPKAESARGARNESPELMLDIRLADASVVTPTTPSAQMRLAAASRRSPRLNTAPGELLLGLGATATPRARTESALGSVDGAPAPSSDVAQQAPAPSPPASPAFATRRDRRRLTLHGLPTFTQEGSPPPDEPALRVQTQQEAAEVIASKMGPTQSNSTAVKRNASEKKSSSALPRVSPRNGLRESLLPMTSASKVTVEALPVTGLDVISGG